MNTVDPAAEYGAKEERKREPLLSDGWIDSHELPRRLHGEERVTIEVGMRLMRHEYERLIDEGRLRVVEEVELDASIRGFLMCPSCGRDMRESEWDGWEFCPCGNKIKR